MGLVSRAGTSVSSVRPTHSLSPAMRRTLRLVVLACLVCALSWLSISMNRQMDRVAPIWLSNVVWLVFLLNAPKRRWPALMAAGLLGTFASNLMVGDGAVLASGLSVANGLEALACAAVLRRTLKRRLRMDRVADLLRYGLVATASACGSAVLGAGWLAEIRGAPLASSLTTWALADALGLLVLGPSLIVLADRRFRLSRSRLTAPRSLTVFGVVGAGLLLAALAPQHPLMLLATPALLFAALNLEFGATALVMLIVAAASIGFVAMGWTPAILSGNSGPAQIFWLQAYLMMDTLMAFPVAAVFARRRELEAALIRSRDALTEANELARMGENLAGIGYWRYDYRSGKRDWSEQMYLIYGRDPSIGAPSRDEVFQLVHPDDAERQQRHAEAFARADDPGIDVRILRPDGSVRHVNTRSRAEVGPGGEVLARYGIMTDTTEVRLAEAQARTTEQRYRFLADNAPDMITRTTLQGDILYISPSSVRVFGYTPEEMRQQNAQEMVHPEDFPRVMQGIFRLIEEKSQRLPEPVRYRARNKDGQWIWVETNPTLVFDEHGEPVEFIDIVRNVTQTKQFEAELDEARRRAEAAAAAKSAFLANMSHELRTPLTSIIGFSRLIGEQQDLPGETGHYTKRIRDASEALLAIINDVLDFSKLEVGQVDLESQPLSLSRLVEDTAGLLTIQAESKGVALKTLMDPAAPANILGDVARLRQVLLNFLSNAIKFTEQGSVTVSTAYDPDVERLRVSVTDTGAGISSEAVGKLFERFSQAEVSINRTHGGTGLGLAICKGIIELMGGEIGVDTEIGKGSTFWFEIPAVKAEAAEAYVRDVADDVDCPGLRILVVDDTAVNRELVKLMLEPMGLIIQEAGGGSEGVQAALTRPFDLILMDVRMPGVDGLEATRVIRATSRLNARTPILALTADVQADNAAACRAAGMNDVLAKPIVPRELLSKIVHWSSVGHEEELAEQAG